MKEQTISNLKKLKSFHNGSYGADIDRAIQALEQQPCKDCVNRDALINELKCGYWDKNLQSAKNDPCIVDAMIDWSIRTVKSQPTVQPARPKGKWINIGDYNQANCSICDIRGHASYNYCPICGADMRGDANDE